MMKSNASHGKQMAQYPHPYHHIPTIHNFPIEQLHQLNRKPEEWKDYMEEEIRKATPNHGDSMVVNISTFRKAKVIGFVPRALFEVKPHSYCPRVLTIGPLYQNLEPSPMDRCKALCVKKFMERHQILNTLEEFMKELIPPHTNELSNIYFGLSPAYNSESLRLLVTVDTIFIHEFLLFLSEDCTASQEKKSGYLYTFINNDITKSQIWRDLLLLGNQIPMSFLKKLINIPKELPDFTEDSLLKCLKYFVPVNDPFVISRFPNDSNETEQKWKQQNVKFLDCEHLLDCLYVSCTHEESLEHSMEPETPANQRGCVQLLNILPCCKKIKSLVLDCLPATTSGPSKFCTWLNQGWQKRKKHGDRLQTACELSKAGIRFTACEGNISVIKYDKTKSRLYLPRLVVYDGTEDVLRNILAHEQTTKEDEQEGKVCGYAMIMDSLIDTQEDIAILTRAKVLENHLGSDERLVQMWNEMCINIWEGSFPEDFKSMINEIMGHYRIHWRVLYVEFWAKFCSRPWLWMSAMAAVILLILSLLQTIFTILG